MIRWILIILGIVVLIFLAVFIIRGRGGNDDPGVADTTTPIAVADVASGTTGQPITGNVLINDTDAEGSALTVNTTPINAPTNGSLQLNADGTFTYTPNTDYVGTDSFTYQVCDAAGNCTEATVQITVNGAVADTGAPTEPVDNGQGGVDEGNTGETPADNTNSGGETNTPAEGSGDSTDSSTNSGNETGNNADASSGNTNNDSSTSGDSGTSGEGTASTDDSQNNTDTTTDTGGSGGQGGQGGTTHVVKQGEWLIQIARCYGTDPITIRNDNQIPYPGWIMPDEELVISSVGSVSEPFNEPCVMFYTVEQGDTLYSIAQQYQVDLDMLLKANYGCYGYGYHYYPPVPTPYEEGDAEAMSVDHDGDWYSHPNYGYGPGYGSHSPYVYTGCYFPSHYNPTIYIGQELVIPVNSDNASMRP